MWVQKVATVWICTVIFINFMIFLPIFSFLAIFRNEITTILTPSISKGGEWGARGGHVFRFGGPWSQIRNVNILIYLYMYKKLRYKSQFWTDFHEIHTVRVHSWVNSMVFGNKRPNRTTHEDGNLFPLAPPWEEIDICARVLFCMKFNFEQLLFKAFFDAKRIFGIVEPQTESTFLFLYIIIFQRWESFEPPNSTRGGGRDRHMRLGTFRTKFNFKQLLFEAFLDVMRICSNVGP